MDSRVLGRRRKTASLTKAKLRGTRLLGPSRSCSRPHRYPHRAIRVSLRRLSTDLAVVLALLAAAVVMFEATGRAWTRSRPSWMTALPLTGVIGTSEALAGFSAPNIVLIAAPFVIGEGLVRTGRDEHLVVDGPPREANQDRDRAIPAGAAAGMRRAPGGWSRAG
jgi:hypothetical protein